MAREVYTPLAVSLILVFLLAVLAVENTNDPRPSLLNSSRPSRSFFLEGNALSGWNGTNPGPTVQVSLFDNVTITINSVDTNPHNFHVDLDGSMSYEPGEPHSGPAGTSPPPYSFNATQAGSFTYYCRIHPTSMFGPFTVQP